MKQHLIKDISLEIYYSITLWVRIIGFFLGRDFKLYHYFVCVYILLSPRVEVRGQLCGVSSVHLYMGSGA